MNRPPCIRRDHLMSAQSSAVSIQGIKGHLVARCGYRPDLIREDYSFNGGRPAQLAAFAHRPFDARSACIGAITAHPESVKQAVMAQRELGAPVVFACFNGGAIQVWRPGRDDAQCIEQGLRGGDITTFFNRHAEDLAPSRIYDAKTLGRLPGSSRQLDLVDTGLLPFVESRFGTKLTVVVEDVIDTLRASFGRSTPSSPKERASQERWIFKSTFVLLAAKILKDKRTPGFHNLRIEDIEDVITRVQKHYGANEPIELTNKLRTKALRESAAAISRLSSLQNVTTEALAEVYERALIDKSTRKKRGTHSTPPYLVDYILGQLTPWIEKMNPLALTVLEPACGHAPFLVGMMRLMRSLTSDRPELDLSESFRRNFFGVEADSFALELARLSLTVADVPNPNGWSGLRGADMFAGDWLDKQAAVSRVLLTNPPFESNKPLKLLERTLAALPPGAVFGAVVPTTLLFSTKGPDQTELRKFLLKNFQIAEVSLFPDKIFEFAQHECSVLLGRRMEQGRQPHGLVHCRRVREAGIERFRSDYGFTTDRTFLQRRLIEQPNSVPWVPELDEEVWTHLRDFPTLGAIAQIGQGLFYKGKEALKGKQTIADEKASGFHAGYDTSSGRWFIHAQPKLVYFNLDDTLIDRSVLGLELGKSKVVLNYAAAGREAWRLKPFIDREGRPIASRLTAVLPKSKSTPIEYLWALCCSPIAHAYVYTHALKRDITVGLVRSIPIPHQNEETVQRVTAAARVYLDAAAAFDAASSDMKLPLFAGRRGQIPKIEDLHRLLMRMDAEVLRAFDLPAGAERTLLNLFAHTTRPGVPGSFKQYYPDSVRACIPLYVLLSDTYSRSLRGESPELPAEQQERYETLLEKQARSTLSTREREELHRLQAEVDGRDYALRPPDDGWLSSLRAQQDAFTKRIGAIADAIETMSAWSTNDES